MNLEELYRKHLHDAETTPPEELWSRIESRMNGQQPTSNSQQSSPARVGKWKMWLAGGSAVLAAGCIAVAMTLALKSPEQISGADTHPEVPAMPVANGQTMDEETVSVAEADDITVNEDQAIKHGTQAALLAADNQAIKHGTQAALLAADNQAINHGTQAALLAADNQALNQSDTQLYKQQDSEEETDVQEGKESVAIIAEEPTASKSPSTNEAHKTEDLKAVKSEVDRSLAVPNLITPNGDGYNDCWKISGREKYGTFVVTIYNAQGKQVYHVANYQNDFCGDALPDGNYFYLISIPEKNYTRRGALVIRR